VTPNYAVKDNQQSYKKAFNKENQELSREVSPALFKPNRSTSRAGYKRSPKASDKYSINSLKKKKRLNSLSFLF
jgi:hypothetical protein